MSVESPRAKAKASRKTFTDTNVLRLPSKPHQHFVWDAGTGAARGLSVLVNPTGTKTYFVNYRFPGTPRLHYMKIGAVGVVTVAEARTAALAARRLASQGKDPKASDPNRSDNFETVWEKYIKEDQIKLKNNASALKTRGVVLHHCGDWKQRAVATIVRRDIKSLLEDKQPATATRLHAHLRDFFRYCVEEEIVGANPVATIPAPTKVKARDRFYTDDELVAIWTAADRLGGVEGSYTKLMMLLALRREELALSEWSEFDAELSLFTVPTERVKLKASAKLDKKPVYKVPLPPLAQRIIKGLKRDDVMLFPGLDANRLKEKLVREGAPADFLLHTFRHTVATWLETAGRNEYERGLVLNHSGSGSVTSGYSHGYPVELKLKLLAEWADHIARLVEPAEGDTRLM